MKNFLICLISCLPVAGLSAQTAYTLEDCRRMAVEHNKSLEIAKESIRAANELKKAAFTQFLPSFAANGTYTWNERNISLLSEDKYLPVYTTKSDGSLNFAGSVNNNWTVVNGTYVPLDANGQPFDPAKNPEKILWKNYALLPKEAMEFDIKNIFTGTIGFTQPVYMGGKIRELYKLSGYAKNLAEANEENKTAELLAEVDEAYWRVISLQNKFKLAGEYRALLRKMDADVNVMIEEGVATKADGLKVRVKLNESEVMFTKAENGLSLSRMALNQLCGIELDSPILLADTDVETSSETASVANMGQAIENRPEIRALKELQNIAGSNEKLMISRFLPTVALTGGYLMSNPNVFNGYSNEFSGMYTMSVVMHVPIFHFGDKIHTLKAAKYRQNIASLQIDEAREKINLQINQNIYKINESIKRREATRNNIEQAAENLKCATEGFAEGVITSTDLLGAQTAWLSAKSEDIDAAIDVMLNHTYLDQSTGTLASQYNRNEDKKSKK
jgi:outer membrane protein TolC